MIRSRHLKMASRFLAHRFRELHPFEVQASLLNACNLRCVYCCCPDIKTRMMTTEQWKTIIRSLGALGTMRIKFQGGEPTLRADFRDLCSEVQKAGIICAVITHGLEVANKPELLDYLDEIVFSLDSATPEINDSLRGQGTHAEAVKAIDIARHRGLRTYLSMVVNKETLGEVEALLEFCEARGVGFHAQPIIFGRQYFDETARRLALTDEEVRALHKRLAGWKSQGRRLMFSVRSYEKTLEWKDYGELAIQSPGESSCMAGKDYIHIEPNGDVLPCNQHGANFTPKNIIKDGLDEALRHTRRHNCGDCFSVFLNERKALFGLRPAALREVVRRG
ncbi:MAG: radical SAM protein [Nitrospinae bacterium]|nr:radical SAM protein [Nitrospinota bacterium]